MLDIILKFDEYLFLLINGINIQFLNSFFKLASSHLFFIFPFLIFIYLQININLDWLKKILFICFSIGFVDYTIYNIFKPLFHRLRPCHFLILEYPNKIIGKCGGQFSFFSNHAGNAFTFIFCIYLIFNITNIQKIMLLVWAVLVCISRVYNGVHYPLDVIIGAFYGILISNFFFNIYNKQFLKL